MSASTDKTQLTEARGISEALLASNGPLTKFEGKPEDSITDFIHTAGGNFCMKLTKMQKQCPRIIYENVFSVLPHFEVFNI